MPDKHAYRASDELAAALDEYQEACRAFQRDVIDPWEAAHPETTSLWVRPFLDLEMIGFKDHGGQVPEGLSRAKSREALLPRRGAAGAPWGEAMMQLNRRPQLAAVFHRFGIETTIMRVDHSRVYTPGLTVTPLGTFIFWGVEHPNPGDHLTPVPLSVFYTACEARDAQKAQATGEQVCAHDVVVTVYCPDCDVTKRGERTPVAEIPRAIRVRDLRIGQYCPALGEVEEISTHTDPGLRTVRFADQQRVCESPIDDTYWVFLLGRPQ